MQWFSWYNIYNKGEFVEYINYTRGLGFEQDPDYEYLRSLFKSIMNKSNLIHDFEFDWISKGINV